MHRNTEPNIKTLQILKSWAERGKTSKIRMRTKEIKS